MIVELKKAILTRKSEREFSQVPLTDEELQYIYWAAYKVPSAGALYPLVLMVVQSNPTYFVICADFSKTTIKYGERGIRYVYMEAGHTAQNIQLIATELGLASYCIGAFDDNEWKRKLNIEEDPIYIVAVGHRKEK
jgi:nitroreductase